MKIPIFILNFLILFKSFSCDEKETKTSNPIAGSKDEESQCGGTFSGFQYSIKSPNYPKNYPLNQNCVYTLKGSKFAKCDQEFHLQFLDFQLEASDACAKDFFKVGTGSVYCGNSIGIRKFKGQDKSLKLIFHSDGNTTARGFSILVTTLPCTDSLDLKQNSTLDKSSEMIKGAIKTKENVKISYPVYRPEIEFEEEEVMIDDGRGDQPPSRFSLLATKNPSENLELPEYQRHQEFNDYAIGKHEGEAVLQGSWSPRITSYLFLPPTSLSRPLKINGAKTGLNSSSLESIPNQVVIRHFDEPIIINHSQEIIPDSQFTVNFAHGQPENLVIPSRGYPQVLEQTRNNPPQFYDASDRWLTYGTPNNAPTNPTNNYDPFANDDDKDNLGPNCGGKSGTNPNNNGNFYPVTPNPVPFYPGPNINGYYPNTNFGNGNGNGNGYPGVVGNFDPTFGTSGFNNNPVNFVPDFNTNYRPNNSPNNPFYSPGDTTYNTGSSSECCGSIYSAQSLLLASPGFPSLIYSSRSYDCQYTIRKSSSNVCQLQMYLKFFNFGSEDQFCAYGYIEVDGRRFCGCKTGKNITVSFDGTNTKIISVKYLGYPRVKFSGFVIEVTQQSCSTGVSGFGAEDFGFRSLYKRSDAIDSEKHLPTDETVETKREKRDAGYFYPRPSSGTSAALLHSQNFIFGTCQVFKFLNWVKAAKQVYLRSAQCSNNAISSSSSPISSPISLIPIFPDNGNAALINFPSTANCQIVNVVEGTISSPSYPNGYAGNLNLCYRFLKAPGYCQLEIAILDFDLETSIFCKKDYMSFSWQKKRYCGSSLRGARTIFDITQSTFADLYFVTDSAGTGRGFRAGFTQISC